MNCDTKCVINLDASNISAFEFLEFQFLESALFTVHVSVNIQLHHWDILNNFPNSSDKQSAGIHWMREYKIMERQKIITFSKSLGSFSGN